MTQSNLFTPKDRALTTDWEACGMMDHSPTVILMLINAHLRPTTLRVLSSSLYSIYSSPIHSTSQSLNLSSLCPLPLALHPLSLFRNPLIT
jgi:hypothetical protein